MLIRDRPGRVADRALAGRAGRGRAAALGGPAVACWPPGWCCSRCAARCRTACRSCCPTSAWWPPTRPFCAAWTPTTGGRPVCGSARAWWAQACWGWPTLPGSTPDIAARIVIFSVPGGPVSERSRPGAWPCGRRSCAAPAELWMAGLFALHAGFHAFRGLVVLVTAPEIDSYFEVSQVSYLHVLVLFEAIFFAFAIGIGFTVMTTVTLNRSLQRQLETRSQLFSVLAHDPALAGRRPGHARQSGRVEGRPRRHQRPVQVCRAGQRRRASAPLAARRPAGLGQGGVRRSRRPGRAVGSAGAGGQRLRPPGDRGREQGHQDSSGSGSWAPPSACACMPRRCCATCCPTRSSFRRRARRSWSPPPSPRARAWWSRSPTGASAWAWRRARAPCGSTA